MSNTEKIVQILNIILPKECEFAGTAYVNDIAQSTIEGNVEFAHIESGSKIDLQSILVTLTTAASLIKDALHIYEVLSAKLNRKEFEITPQILKRELENHNIKNDQINEETLSSICNAINKIIKK